MNKCRTWPRSPIPERRGRERIWSVDFPPSLSLGSGCLAVCGVHLAVGGHFIRHFLAPLSTGACNCSGGRWRGDYGLSPFTVIYSFIPHPLSSPPFAGVVDVYCVHQLSRGRAKTTTAATASIGDGPAGERRVDHRAIKDPHNPCHSAHRIGTVQVTNRFNTRPEPRLRESESNSLNLC